MPDRHHHSETEAMPIQRHRAQRNVLRHLSPQDRIRICRVIHELIALESVEPAAHRRNVLLRLSIGLPPCPRRTVNRDLRQ
jgi:hypothetical protein